MPKRQTALRRSRKKARSHLPSLSQVQRDMLQMTMQSDPRLTTAIVQNVMASFNAAANPQAETPRVVIDSLPQEERALIVPYEASYGQILGRTAIQGQNALMQMTDEQWNSLIDDDA